MFITGIAGRIYRDPQRPASSGEISRMLLAASGEAGVITSEERNAAFGAPAGGLAMNADRSRMLAFAGELYGRAELKGQLAAGAESDSALALAAFDKWGADAGLHLRGVFAFAAYDFNEQALFLIRDHIGMKPLFYAHVNAGKPDEHVMFASEVKSFLADPAFDRAVDVMALNHYLTFQYVPHPWSIFKAARKVAPGHWVRWKNGSVATQRYWELTYEPKPAITEEEAVEQSMARIDEALRVRMESLKPMGVLLSGGVDSSAVVAMLREHVPGDLYTFSVGFREQAFNELPYARQVADKFATKHEEFLVESDALGNLGELAWYYDEPVADSSAVATFHVIREASRRVPVAFLGDGGDESFLGYERYRGFPIFNTYMRIPRWLRAVSDAPFAVASRTLPQINKLELLSYVNKASLMDEEKRYVQTMVYFREYQKPQLLAPEHRHVLHEPGGNSEAITYALLKAHPQRSFAERKPYSDIMTYLPGALIPKVERAAVANGIACRAPILDPAVMEYCAKLPPELKLKNGTLKYLLKKGVLRYFSDEFLNRPKQGFGVPVGEWFRGDRRRFTEDFLLGETARRRGFFDTNYVRRIFEQHASGAQNHTPRLWVLTVFEAWCRTFLDRPDALQQGPIRLE